MVRTRLVVLGCVAVILAVGLGVRALGNGAFAQNAGTALYASMIYAGLFVLWPVMSPVRAGLVAVGFCWAVEVFQLSGIPAELAARSVLARLVLGSHFDWMDLVWYPVGVVPLVLIQRALGGGAIVGPGSRAGRPPG
jgi:hypothetical protein